MTMERDVDVNRMRVGDLVSVSCERGNFDGRLLSVDWDKELMKVRVFPGYVDGPNENYLFKLWMLAGPYEDHEDSGELCWSFHD